MRSAIERRQEILERLSVRRVDTIGNLMVEFGVSRSTIKRDLEIIGLSAPIYTVKGKGGGVRVMNGYEHDSGASAGHDVYWRNGRAGQRGDWNPAGHSCSMEAEFSLGL